MNIESRLYQEIAIADVRTAFAQGEKSVLLVSPTGSGKTCMFSIIAKAAAAKGTRTGILVHRNNLLRQTSSKLSEYGIPHGIVAPGHTPTDDKIHVCSVQTLVRRLDRHEFDFIIPDECQHTPSTMWRKIFSAMPDAKILGVTATPCRADGKGLSDIFDKMVIGPSTKDLIIQGHLVQPVVYASEKKLELSAVHTRAGDYDKAELQIAMDRPVITGCAISHYLKLCPGVPAAVFTVSIQHAIDVAADFNRNGVKAIAVSGKTDEEQVQAALDDLREGRIQVISACDLISEGTDVPCLRAAILLRPTQSEGLYIQQVGRVLRPYPGKDSAIILDHAGNVFRHGMPDDDRAWSLEGIKANRKSDGKSIPVKQCPKCYACFRPVPKCPQCGYVFEVEGREIEKEAGALALVDPNKLKSEVNAKARSCNSLAEMQALGKSLGYKPGWAWFRWKLKCESRRRTKDLLAG